MSKDEVIKEITKNHKWYIGVMPQSTASNFLASYKKGMSKEKTINNFLSKFGYVKTKDEVWGKSEKYK